MLATLNNLLVLAVDEGNGRGDDASGGTGIAVILGIVLLVALIILAVTMLLRKRGGREGQSPAMDDREHRPGGVGRST